jgi:hypothetical protein
MLPKSDYKWKFKDNILFIQDLNLGRMSVTNNIENVLSEIKDEMGEKITEAKIIYKDSQGVWDGVIPEWTTEGCSSVRFYYIGETSLVKAIKKIK